ncbi:hypothetical protein KR009_007878 [Drosophila setifemur]|nr:hypothetical protein KR009_007878 [Drosophila setifemur]
MLQVSRCLGSTVGTMSLQAKSIHYQTLKKVGYFFAPTRISDLTNRSPIKNISKHLFEKARAEENVHFLKLQREQLKSLRLKILGQKNAVTSKINEVDKQIKSLEQTDTKRTGSKLH